MTNILKNEGGTEVDAVELKPMLCNGIGYDENKNQIPVYRGKDRINALLTLYRDGYVHVDCIMQYTNDNGESVCTANWKDMEGDSVDDCPRCIYAGKPARESNNTEKTKIAADVTEENAVKDEAK